MPAEPLKPSPQLLEKLAQIVHASMHYEAGIAGEFAHDPEVIEWAKAMRAIGRLPPLGAGR